MAVSFDQFARAMRTPTQCEQLSISDLAIMPDICPPGRPPNPQYQNSARLGYLSSPKWMNRMGWLNFFFPETCLEKDGLNQLEGIEYQIGPNVTPWVGGARL